MLPKLKKLKMKKSPMEKEKHMMGVHAPIKGLSSGEMEPKMKKKKEKKGFDPFAMAMNK
jgi:hypothetical protein